jgi:glycosyltransferase involved in cell wall biosynthesis
VAAKIDPVDVGYFRARIAPLFDDKRVRFLGEIVERDKPRLYAGAAATLFPSDWPEPFGLVMLESMAAGTPVIALRRGSVPEIIIDGVTGFICDDIDDMVRAVGRLDDIDPDACRAHARTFSAARMCAAYEHVYRTLARPMLPLLDKRAGRLPAQRTPFGQTSAGLAP